MKKIETGCQDKPDWFDGKHINEILFCQEFLENPSHEVYWRNFIYGGWPGGK